MDKISRIESLSKRDLIDTICKVLEVRHFQLIETVENGVLAQPSDSLSNVVFGFFVAPERLSGTSIELAKECYLDTNSKYHVNVFYFVSQFNISNGFKSSFRSVSNAIEYIDRDSLISLIDKTYPDFWRHDDSLLLQYEQDFISKLDSENGLKKLKIANEKSEKLLSIYINPLVYAYDDSNPSHTPTRKRLEIEDMVKSKNNYIIYGLAGVGKSTLLKQIGKSMIDNNAENPEIRQVPVYLSTAEIFRNEHNVTQLLKERMKQYFDKSIDEVLQSYCPVLLIDSIDEFEDNYQKDIMRQLNNLSNNGVRYLIGTRHSEKLSSYVTDLSGAATSCEVSKFNTEQIKRFLSAFFSGDEVKSDNLMEALRENKIIDKLPITPLTLSLISILYEEADFEIPATITDIYDNFNTLIVGKGVVSSKIEFIDVSFKERILSIYGLYLLEQESHQPLDKDSFIRYFVKFFEGKTLPIKDAQLEDVLEYLINNTGILCLKEDTWVEFTHDSYMEYYASIEIFNYCREEKEQLLIDNFYDPYWQNVAVFYAGRTKDMPTFLERILNKIKTAYDINDILSAIQGSGYLIQALYQTKNDLRRDVILADLNLLLESMDLLKRMGLNEQGGTKYYKIPLVMMVHFVFFYEVFNSITLKAPLEQSFAKLYETYQSLCSNQSKDYAKLSSVGYKLVQLAFTLDSKRINSEEQLSALVSDETIIKNPTLNLLTLFALSSISKPEYKELKESIAKQFVSLTEVKRRLIEAPAHKIRFSPLDGLLPERKVKLIVEGKTDAIILEHAFDVLTDGQRPYWMLSPATSDGVNNGSDNVKKAMEIAATYSGDYDCIIGVLDHDYAGLSVYKYLKNDFRELKINTIKQHKQTSNLYLLCLPIPGEMSKYIQEKDQLNFFEVEHYFGEDYLVSKKMTLQTPIPGILEIVDKRKNEFSISILKEFEPSRFRYFLDLFHLIDSITGVTVDYIL